MPKQKGKKIKFKDTTAIFKSQLHIIQKMESGDIYKNIIDTIKNSIS